MHIRTSAMRGALTALAVVFTSLSAPVWAQISYSGDTTGGATFNRPQAGIPPTLISGVGTAVPYSAHDFTVTTSGGYDILSTAVGAWDNFTVLYSGGFNPASPLANAIAANDDFPTVGVSGFSGFQLTAGTNYTLVTTGFGNTDFGAFNNSINRLAPAPPPPATDLGVITKGARTVNVGTIPANGVQWFSFFLGNAVSDATGYYLDFDTYNPATDGLDPDTEIGLYRADGTRIATNDDDLFNLSSQLTFGDSSPARPAVNDFGFLFDGFDGPLSPGTYYLALGGYNTTFGANGFNVTASSPAASGYLLNFRSNVVPEPGSVALFAGSGVVLLAARRRRLVRK